MEAVVKVERREAVKCNKHTNVSSVCGTSWRGTPVAFPTCVGFLFPRRFQASASFLSGWSAFPAYRIKRRDDLKLDVYDI